MTYKICRLLPKTGNVHQNVVTPCCGPAAVGLCNKYMLAIGGTLDRIFTLNSTATTWMRIASIPSDACYPVVVCDNDSRL